jgi:hypothetical protein
VALRAATIASSSGLAGFAAADCTEVEGSTAEGAEAVSTDGSADATRVAVLCDKAACTSLACRRETLSVSTAERASTVSNCYGLKFQGGRLGVE